jgi:choline dehydrogenase-like flavoprotein
VSFVLDPRSEPDPARADVLIVGAGPAGAVAARVLAGSGRSVVCLEQGPWQSRSDYPGDKPELPLLSNKRWSWNPNVRGLPEDYPCEVSGAEVHPLMANAVGGSTIHFGGNWMRFLPSDFRVRSLDAVADDWPISYETLEPHYDAVDRWIGISGLPDDPAGPPVQARRLPPLPIGKMGMTAARGMNSLGWHWWPGTHAIASVPHGRLAPCARRAVCGWGCPEGAKGSADLALWPDAIASGARLVPRARVCQITIGARGLATGAIWVDPDGREHHQLADVVLLAANAVGTARLLLLSAAPGHHDGLANSCGLVGKNLMMHPVTSVLGVYEEDLESWLGPLGSPVYSLQFAEGNPDRGFPRGAKWEACGVPGPVELLERHQAMPARDRTGARMHRLVAERFGRCFEWVIIAEDLPNPDNAVSLDGRLTDSSGVPAPKITYRIADQTRAALSWNTERAAEAHRASGAVTMLATQWMPESGWHILGTARMGEDPATSVVNQYGRAHDVPNLYIVDGSVFVTSSCVNPTATICALAHRCAWHIVKYARHQVVPR